MSGLVVHRCPGCGALMGAPATATVEHRCPVGRRIRRFKVDAQPSETKGKR